MKNLGLVFMLLACWGSQLTGQCIPWTPCDDGDPFTIVDKWDDDCNCVGSFINYDVDSDGVFDYQDNCPTTPNPDQADSDFDGIGDVCDPSPSCTPGDSCDDGDPNTINDTLTPNCVCEGEFVNYDSDNDGVLDFEDNCPTIFNPGQEDTDNDGLGDVCDIAANCTPWDACDDGDPNTINDKWDDNCNCVGSFVNYDVDNDGVLDYLDNCPVTPNSNQLDSDNDGTGDVCDATPFPSCNIGSPCNDNNPNTTNDIYDVNCNCVGTLIILDADNDGINDNADNCPNTFNPDQLDSDNDGQGDVCDTTLSCVPWTACDDGDPNTISDKWDDDCNCVGSFVNYDVDNDGILDYLDNCPVTYNPNQLDSDNDGLGDVCDTTPACNIGGACDDGNPNTTNDIYDVNCNCVGTLINLDADNDGILDNVDNCPTTYNPNQIDSDNNGLGDVCDTNMNCVPWTPCDDGNPDTIQDKWDDDCNCVGSFVNYDVDNDGILDYIDNCPITYNPDQLDSDNDGLGDACDTTPTCTIGGACNDGNPNTTNDIYDVNCNCAGTEIPSCTVGTPCDDGNPNTTDDIYDVNCNCVGTVVPSCTVGTPCDDGNPNTTNDIYDVNCNCVGTATPTNDIDNDGVIDSKDNCPYFYNPGQEDADDDGLGDICDPLPNDCHQIYNYNGFEHGWGIWNDGGNDSYRNYEPAVGANASNYCIRLRSGNGQASSMYTNPIDLSAAASVKVSFMFLPISLEAGEKFVLEYSTNGGNQFTEVKSWVSGQNFTNNLFYTDSVVFTGAFSANTILRFRCQGNSNSDIVYLDEVIISTCVPTGLTSGMDTTVGNLTTEDNNTAGLAQMESEGVDNEENIELESIETNVERLALSVYPNPVSNELTISGLSQEDAYLIYNLNGQIVISQQNQTRVNVSNLESGIYLLRTMKGETLRFIKQ